MRWIAAVVVLGACTFPGAGPGPGDDTPGDDTPPPSTRFASCSDALAQGMTASGVYSLDPGDGGPVFSAYCDMTTAGGGWTLALKADGTLQTFDYDAPIWSSPTAFNAAAADHDLTEAKLDSFARLAADELLIEVDTGATLNKDLAGEYTLYQRFSSNLPELFLMPAQWMTLVPGEVPACGPVDGVNVGDDTYKARLGLVARDYDEDTCTSDFTAAIGVGLQINDDCDDESVELTVGRAYDGCDATAAFAYVYVR